MHHALLVAGLVIGQRARVVQLRLEQRLPDASDIAVAEDAEDTLDETVLDAVALAALGREETHDGLPHGESHCAHAGSPADS